MNSILLIFKGVELLTTVGPIAIETAIAIKALLEQPGSDLTAEIATLRSRAIAAAEETEAIIAKWKLEHGFTD